MLPEGPASIGLVFPVHEDSEINYYETLGLAPGASAEEIRDAFHLHVRLLHPDQQSDPLLRDLAEKQMRRLNRIYAVLSDPESRDAYDLAMDGIPAPPIVNAPPHTDFRRIAAKTPWAAAILLSAAVLIWLAYDATPGTQSRNFDPGSVQANSAPAATHPASAAPERTSRSAADPGQVARLKEQLKTAETQRDQALQELAKLRSAPARQPAETPAVTTTRAPEPVAAPPPLVAELTPAPRLPVPTIAAAAPPRVVHPPNRKLAGFWFYAIPADGQQNKNQNLYLPEYIEASITEENGAIRGRYRSRFVITDRAIPPDVNFTFNGIENGTQCTCQWTGGGGSKGEVTLRLTGDNSMKVDWSASELGSLGLASGTAILTRRIESTN